jgi:hypothetical protein
VVPLGHAFVSSISHADGLPFAVAKMEPDGR